MVRLPKNADRIRSTLVQTVFVGRRESPVGVTYFGENIQDPSAPVIRDPQGAPDPIRQSAYVGIGRAPSQRESTVPLALHLNIAAIHGVMEDSFLSGKVRPVSQASRIPQGYADGGQLPFGHREVIEQGYAAPYGNRVSVQPSQVNYGVRGVTANGLTYDLLSRRV